ncbi:SGNH/GDSL hydrolase family protein [Methylobacterium sp. JK268]
MTAPPLDARPPAKPSALRRHARLAAAVPRDAAFVLLGDSLAAGWPARLLPPGSFNFGLPGDRVQTTRWRLRAVDLRGLAPRAALLLVGTNNLADGDAAAAIAAGLAALAGELRGVWPGASPILATIPWRDAPAREGERRRFNLCLTDLARREGLACLDADALLGGEAGAPLHLAADRLHLSEGGYAALAPALAGLLARP